LAARAGQRDLTRYLVCRGLFSEIYARGARFGLDYFDTQIAALRAQGSWVQALDLPSAAPIGVNASRIAATLLSSPEPVTVIAHSKGGLEALAALIRPGVAAQCAGFLALQCPFHGTPLADAGLAPRPLRLAAHHLLGALQLGATRGVKDLTIAARGRWMQAHAAEIEALVRTTRVLTIGTAMPARPALRDAAFALLARWAEQAGHGPGDGLVPLLSTRLPGARHLTLEGGHRALVARGPGRDPVAVLTRALALLS
jgi:hypothetical protein